MTGKPVYIPIVSSETTCGPAPYPYFKGLYQMQASSWYLLLFPFLYRASSQLASHWTYFTSSGRRRSPTPLPFVSAAFSGSPKRQPAPLPVDRRAEQSSDWLLAIVTRKR